MKTFKSNLKLILNCETAPKEKTREEIEREVAESIASYVNIVDDDGKTALNWATQEAYTEIVEFLIKIS